MHSNSIPLGYNAFNGYTIANTNTNNNTNTNVNTNANNNKYAFYNNTNNSNKVNPLTNPVYPSSNISNPHQQIFSSYASSSNQPIPSSLNPPIPTSTSTAYNYKPQVLTGFNSI